MTDIEIAQEAVLEPIVDVAARAGIKMDDLELYGKYKAKISDEYINSVKDKENGKLILVTAITAIHIQSQLGICIVGNSLTKHATTNTKSATLSNLAPNLLEEFVFLAILPSIISVNPQTKYRI